MQALNGLPPLVNCIPFIGPVISITKVITALVNNEEVPLLQTAMLLRENSSRQPAEHIVKLLKDTLNNQIYGIIGSLATVVSCIALAILTGDLAGGILFGGVYLGIATMLYCMRYAYLHDCKEILPKLS